MWILLPVLVEEPVTVTAGRGELTHRVLPLCSKGATPSTILEEHNIIAETMGITSPSSLGQMNPVVHAWPRQQQIVSAAFGNFPFYHLLKKLLAGAENCGLQPRDQEPKYQRGKSQFLTTTWLQGWMSQRDNLLLWEMPHQKREVVAPHVISPFFFFWSYKWQGPIPCLHEVTSLMILSGAIKELDQLAADQKRLGYLSTTQNNKLVI